MLSLYPHQEKAVNDLCSGSILCGGVGTGKSRTAIAYYFCRECLGGIDKDGNLLKMQRPKDLYIITTARKRDTKDWEYECEPFSLYKEKDASWCNTSVTIDSWNNISKYVDVKDAFFIFDEQRLVGSGTWVKSFIKISKSNNWILLSATPGDTWSDYIPVFVANGFYKNRTEFLRRHAVYNRFTKYPKIDRYVDCGILLTLKRKITVNMPYVKNTVRHVNDILVNYDKKLFDTVYKDRWNPYDEEPIKDISQACYLMRKVVNSDTSRIDKAKELIKERKRLIIFYNFDFELELLRDMCSDIKIPFSEWNGHNHKPIPDSEEWVYLVQYTSGAEGWNCIDTDSILFFSLNYSYKIMEQASGRIDRLNTKYKDLYYYRFISDSKIDSSIFRSLKNKKKFNETYFLKNFLASREKHVL